ncbi:alpha/beta hydrolase fold domain-containing protein [Mariniflexile gromovii]|uniref:Alpha/beta hydrolase n=1 Tax=Mariniflexile gromovii TaxID=362523 RepID=A0ABS4BS73_9FLAO|nr:alpha/beta hydrolase [Mariniflexile gromovii]MBP0903437.1 alpha/beta hydrolase [Mariniflexile gromovii]
MKQRFLFSIFSLVCASYLFSQEKTFKPVSFPKDYQSQIDVIYTQVNGWDGRMDLYTNPTAKTPTPVVINIHGGGWNHGEKESQTGFGSWFKNGYAVANVEYRLVDVAPAPAAIEDVRCALIYLLKNAKSLNIDPDNIVIMGGSSGGHLALMAGLLGNDKRFDTNCHYDGTIKAAAIIDKYGVTDLLPLAKWKSAKNWLGTHYNNQKFVESVSPLYHINKQSPPTFIVHGDADPIVPYLQSVVLHEKLKTHGVKTEFLTIPGGVHGKFSEEQNALLSKRMWDFLNNLGL